MSYTLKLSILNELIKMGKLNSVFGFDGNFTQEQLDSITSLQLTEDYILLMIIILDF